MLDGRSVLTEEQSILYIAVWLMPAPCRKIQLGLHLHGLWYCGEYQTRGLIVNSVSLSDVVNQRSPILVSSYSCLAFAE